MLCELESLPLAAGPKQRTIGRTVEKRSRPLNLRSPLRRPWRVAYYGGVEGWPEENGRQLEEENVKIEKDGTDKRKTKAETPGNSATIKEEGSETRAA